MNVDEIASLLLLKEKTISVAEACTCGLVGYMLSSIPGSSKFFPGGVIAYSGDLKQKMLGVSDQLLRDKGTVSEDVAIAMAHGIREITGTDFGISTTGVAGPSTGKSKLPVGTFYIGLCGPDGLTEAQLLETGASEREDNKKFAANAVIHMLGHHVMALE